MLPSNWRLLREAHPIFRFRELGAFGFESQVQSKYVAPAQLIIFLVDSAAKICRVAKDAPYLRSLLLS
jgi:hypothetical protein